MSIVFYMHTGSGNHGCEALVRSSVKLIKQYTNQGIVLWSDTKTEEYEYGVDSVVNKIISTDEVDKFSFGFVFSYIKFRFFNKKDSLHKLFVKKTFLNNIAISIGGDNYCYPWSAARGIELDKEIRQYSRKNVFWGCSIEEEFMDKKMIEDLRGFDLITVRESLSYNVLKKYGIKSVLVSDPAFLLDKIELPLPENFLSNNTIGINISPMINDYESGEGIAFSNYVNLINYILSETDMNVCLVPHVVWSYNDDRKLLSKLYDMFSDSNRIVLLDDYSCEELKGYISRCRFFVGARTHSTIAAYSSCVPTLVVGYSIKSRGIAKDLFGSYDNYVVSVQSLNDKNVLVNKFKYFLENEEIEKNKLKKIIPKYIEKACLSGIALSKLLNY